MAKSAGREPNPIDVVEAAYNLEVDDQTWLDTLAKTVRPLLDTGTGMLAYAFDFETSPEVWYEKVLLYDMDRADVPRYTSILSTEPDLLKVSHVNFEGLLGLTELGFQAGLGDVRKRPNVAKLFALIGCADFAALQTVEPGGKGVVFAAGQDEHRIWDRRTRRLWGRVNVHVAAGRRLRAAIAKDAGAVEAVLRPDGRIEHAEGDALTKTARDLLREAVGRQEKARGKQRKADPERAAEAWTGMVSGRWSLVDRFEGGGRRYIVARRNEHSLPDPRALTPRERTVAQLAALGKPNKLIGYELGLAESTIGSHLSTAMRKLGAKSRVELIELVHQLGPKPGT